jgi:uncharacterized protein YxjI
MITHFTIYGERNSGTKLLQKIISECFDLELTWHFGFKHFFGHHNEMVRSAQEVLFLGIVRNPYNWINSMINKPYHAPKQNRKSITDFLFNEWYSIQEAQDHRTIPVQEKEIIQDRYWIDNTRHNNIFEMRKRKLLFLAKDMHELNTNYYSIRYEDLCESPQKTLTDISDRFNIKQSRKTNTKIRVNKNKIQNKIINIVNENVDWKNESLFNYERILIND